MRSELRYVFSKCLLRYFTELIGLDVHLLQKYIHCCDHISLQISEYAEQENLVYFVIHETKRNV